MAQLINLRMAEYELIQNKLSDMHTLQIENIRQVIGELKNLVSDENLFFANETSEKVLVLLEVLSTEVIPLLEQAFEDSELGVVRMVEKTIETDAVGN